METRKDSIMSGARIRILVSGFMFLLTVLPVFSYEAEKNPSDTNSTSERESIFPQKSLDLSKSHFTWGAEAGASIDCSGHDLSTFDVDVNLGYKNSFIDLIGFSAGIHRTVQSGANFIPLCLVFRSSFKKSPSLLFFNLKLGYSFNTIGDSPTFGDQCSSIGCGINLSRGRKVRSYIIASAGYRYFNERHKSFVNQLSTHYVFIAQLSFGVNF